MASKKKSLWNIRENTHLEKGPFEPNVRQSERFLRPPRHPGASKTGDNNAKIWFLEGWASFETRLNLFWAHFYFAQKLEIALNLYLRLLWTYVWDCLRVTLMEPISEHLQNHAIKHYLQNNAIKQLVSFILACTLAQSEFKLSLSWAPFELMLNHIISNYREPSA